MFVWSTEITTTRTITRKTTTLIVIIHVKLYLKPYTFHHFYYPVPKNIPILFERSTERGVDKE